MLFGLKRVGVSISYSQILTANNNTVAEVSCEIMRIARQKLMTVMGEKEMTVTIYAMTHKKFEQPRNPIYVPLQVGHA